ncbi:MAG: hypothetical protein J6Q38_01040 [Clostridia bacterium]|nr:hypothetical protein [Clostridia bacterium]
MELNKNQAGESKKDFDTENSEISVHTAEADDSLGTADTFGKFKDAKSLLNAYNALQSEFTRRCQKVKELEREIASTNKEQSKDSLISEREWEEKAFSEYFPNANIDVSSLYDATVASGDNSKGRLGRAYLKKIVDDYESKMNYLSSDEYALNLISNQGLKNKIIEEYLKQIESSKPTVRLISGNGLATVSPPSTPKSLAEAGDIARQIFEKSKENILL